MILCLINNKFAYELEKLCRIFLPFEKIVVQNEICDTVPRVEAILSAECGKTAALAKIVFENEEKSKSEIIEGVSDFEDKECERVLAVLIYKCFCEIFGVCPQWGILTGVRPAKLYGRLCEEYGREYARNYFKEKLYVSDKKAALCEKVSVSEEKLISLSGKKSFSLYISIPFCPSRCSYCSFVSHSVAQAGKLIPRYVELLCKEIKATGEIAKDLGLELMSVYFGGGTPTTLSAEQISLIMKTVKESFDLSHIMEYTVEAGRPDTVTKEKLSAIKDGGATRISINPQTLNDDILRNIGRKHTVSQFYDAFAMARECGFNNINTDLIAGLPGQTPETFKNTLDGIIKILPESVTVHSLSMKRASTLSKESKSFSDSANFASEMVDSANEMLTNAGLLPYYMYRQSKTVGNLENTGYAIKGYEGIYNVYIMDETHTILACGASAVTKMRSPKGREIERIFNFKYPYEYIDRFSELLERKKKVMEFYDKFGNLH